MDLTSIFHINPVDIIIGIISYILGRYSFKDKRGLGLFLQVSILLIRISKHYFDTHPEAGKLAHNYKLKVDRLYHDHVHKKHTTTGAAG